MIKLKPLYEIKLLGNITPEKVIELFLQIRKNLISKKPEYRLDFYDILNQYKFPRDIWDRNRPSILEEWVRSLSKQDLLNIYYEFLKFKEKYKEELDEIKIFKSGDKLTVRDLFREISDKIQEDDNLMSGDAYYDFKDIYQKAGFHSMNNWYDVEFLPKLRLDTLYQDLLDFNRKYKII